MPVLAMVLFVSCTKQNDQLDNPPAVVVPKGDEVPVGKVENGCLVFDDVEQLEKTVVALISMDTLQLNNWYAELNFNSLNSLFEQAQNECSNFTKFDDYLVARSKYKDIFLFDDDNKEFLAPALKITKPLYAYVLNENGEVTIGGEKIGFNSLTSFNQTDFVRMAPKTTKSFGVSEANNYLHVYDDKRKIWVYAEPMFNVVFLRFGQQVRSFWGWNIYKENFKVYRLTSSKQYPWDPLCMVFGQWNSTGVITNGTKVVHGYRKDGNPVYVPIDEKYSIYANDMGIEKAGTLRMFL